MRNVFINFYTASERFSVTYCLFFFLERSAKAAMFCASTRQIMDCDPMRVYTEYGRKSVSVYTNEKNLSRDPQILHKVTQTMLRCISTMFFLGPSPKWISTSLFRLAREPVTMKWKAFWAFLHICLWLKTTHLNVCRSLNDCFLSSPRENQTALPKMVSYCPCNMRPQVKGQVQTLKITPCRMLMRLNSRNPREAHGSAC